MTANFPYLVDDAAGGSLKKGNFILLERFDQLFRLLDRAIGMLLI